MTNPDYAIEKAYVLCNGNLVTRDNIIYVPIYMTMFIDKKHLGGENFAEYSSRVPGCYMFVGIATDRTEGKFGLHSPVFEIAEEVLAPASAVFANIVLNYFEQETEVEKCLR